MNDPYEETRHVLTPNGGVYCVFYYLDDKGNPNTRSVATHVKIEEYSENNTLIKTHLAYLGEPDV